MLRSAFFFACFALPWLPGGTGWAQVTTPLQLKPNRMRHARFVEQQAILKNDSLMLAEAWYLYGKTYVFAGDYKAAQNYFLKSLRIHQPRGDSFHLSRLYVRLSESEDRLGHSPKALRYANIALQIAQRIHSDSALIRAYSALGHHYEGMWDGRLTGDRREYNRILTFYRKQEYLCHKLNDSLGIAEVNVELGALFTRAKEPQALDHLKNALVLFTAMNKEGSRVNAMLHLAGAYLTFSKPQFAYQMLQDAERFYDRNRLNEYDLRVVLERKYVDYFQAMGQWETAFVHLERLHALEKSQLMADNNGAIARLNVEYETEQNNARLNAQHRELTLSIQNLRTQRRFTVAMSGLFLLAAGLGFLFFRQNSRNKRISQRNEELVKEQNHRVKNNLQVVSSLLSLQSKRLTDETARKAVEESRLRVESMAILHRRLYDGDKLAMVNVNEFIRELVGGVLKSYGFDWIRPQFTIGDISLSADKAVPFGLILNELTTNACKYAFPHTNEPELTITCYRTKNKLELRVADNGPGLEGPGRTDARLERPDFSTNGYQVDEGHTGTVSTLRTTTFGMQLIQAQVEQLHGTGRFTANQEAVLIEQSLREPYLRYNLAPEKLMNTLKILIVEDNTITAMDLRETLERVGHTVTAVARTFRSALVAVKTNPPDLALIDIELDDSTANGIDTARELLAHHPMPIIYLTANSDPKTFQAAKETLPAAYLLKPFRSDELILNIELAYHYFLSTAANAGDGVPGHLLLPVGRGHEHINLNDVLYVEADGAYVKIFLVDRQQLTISTNLGHLAQYFRTPNFFRLSRSHLVNLNYIKRLKDNGLLLSDNPTILPIPANIRKELLQKLTVVKTK